MLVKGTVNVQILYESAEEEVPCGCLKGELVFEELLETAEPVKNTCSCRIEAGTSGRTGPPIACFRMACFYGKEAGVRAVVCVKGLICADCEEEIVTDALLRAPDPEKQANQPGIVVYLAGEGETLWDICKKYDVPMDGMREMNNLTQDEIHPGDQLLIVKGYAVDKGTQIV